ncbi:MAG: rod shape-determining protein RodA, partial [Alphaproteobacteria bacterium]
MLPDFSTPLFHDGIYKRCLRLNWLFILMIMLWAAIGIALLYSAAGGDFNPWAMRQLIYLGIGFCIMIGLALTNPQFWMNYAYVIYGGALLLLVAVELVGATGMGAQRWLDLKFFRLQPSELMKAAMVLALARYFHGLDIEDTGKIKSLIIPFLLLSLPVLLVLRQPDLGTAILIVIGGLMVMFLAGIRLWKFVVMGASAVAAVPLAWNFILHDYQKRRILIFLEPERDPLGAGYHITQSKIALGSGGMFGRGYMNGPQSQNSFLPEKHTDFIFTMLGEEMGLRGTFGLLILFCGLLAVGAVLSLRASSQFNRLVGFGMINNFALYVIINIAMVTGLAPVVGVPLPLISYGGSATISVMAGFGLVLMV